MKRVKLITGILGLALLASCNSTKQLETKSLKSIAEKSKASVFKNYDEKEVRSYFKEGYIQHNPNVPTGIEPVVAILPTLQSENTTYTTHRVLQDGNFVVLHNSYQNATKAFGHKDAITFEVLRIENEKVAEHWDATTPIVLQTASGRSQTDGPTAIIDLGKTDENKLLVNNFLKDVLMGENPSKITEYISSEQYDQHNPMVKDGLKGLGEAIEYLASQDNLFKYYKIHKVLGEGNFVFTQSEGEWNKKPYAFYDLFRVQDGKIVEHWDVVQEIPEEMAHNNGMF